MAYATRRRSRSRARERCDVQWGEQPRIACEVLSRDVSGLIASVSVTNAVVDGAVEAGAAAQLGRRLAEVYGLRVEVQIGHRVVTISFHRDEGGEEP